MKLSQSYLRYSFMTAMAVVGTFAFVSFAHAQEITAGNSTTGFESDNQAVVDLSSETNIDINNDADIQNDININASTGNNSASWNTGDGTVITGDASVVTDLTTDVNRVSLGNDGGFGSDSSITALNDTTGAFSDNTVDVDVDHETNVDIDNDADVDNDVDVDLETGCNEANGNLGDGTVVSGDASFEGDFDTVANVVELGLGHGSGDLDLDLRNERTGFDSENVVDVDIDKELDVDIDNDADIDNDIDIDADTGGNEANWNLGDAEVSSGDVDVDISAETVANLVELDLGDCGESIDAELINDTTGAESFNEIDLDLDSETDIDIDNDADVDNDIDVDADTGNNEANGNGCGDAFVESGDVEVDFDLATKANIVELDLGEGGDDLSIEAGNTCTGLGSDNVVDIDVDRDFDVDIDNDLDVDNDIDIDAETGNNEASFNNGDAEVRSGDVEIEGELVTKGNFVELSSGLFDLGDLDIEAFNDTTGSCSDNVVELDIEDDIDLDIDNDTDVDNDVDIDLETGDNIAEANCEDGEVESGDLDIDICGDTVGGIVETGDFDDFDGSGFTFDRDFSKDLDGDGEFNISIDEDGKSII